MNLPPALLPAFLLSTAFAAAFHLWGGRTLRDLFAYLLASGLGFGLGHLLGNVTQLPLLQVGGLHLLEGAAGAWLALFIARALQEDGMAQARTESERR